MVGVNRVVAIGAALALGTVASIAIGVGGASAASTADPAVTSTGSTTAPVETTTTITNDPVTTTTAPPTIIITTSAPAPSGGPAAVAGSAYLVKQLIDGNHLNNDYGVDYGLTADLAIALASTNDQDPALARVVGYLRAHVADYADPAGTGQYPGPYSGAVAKLALVAEITGQDPHSFGGFDLLKVLTDNVCTGPDSSGYLCTAAGDFTQSYSTISQSLAVLALARAGETVPAPAVARLEALQCSDGGFSSALITSGQTCTSDVDTTAFAAQALALVPAAVDSVSDARNYLLDAQQADGGFISAAGENANSTGLALQALLATDSTLPPVRAVAKPQAVAPGTDPQSAGITFLVSQQQSNGGFQASTTKAGADVRATTQAVPALAGQVLSTLADAVTPVAPPVSTSSAPSTSPAPSRGTGSSAAGSVAPSSSSSAAAASDPGALANTGASTTQPLTWAALLILAGALAMVAAGRSRSLVVLRARRSRRH